MVTAGEICAAKNPGSGDKLQQPELLDRSSSFANVSCLCYCCFLRRRPSPESRKVRRKEIGGQSSGVEVPVVKNRAAAIIIRASSVALQILQSNKYLVSGLRGTGGRWWPCRGRHTAGAAKICAPSDQLPPIRQQR